MACAQAHSFVEFFSGQGCLTWCLRHEGFCGVQFDKDFGGRYNNIFEPAGFARLAIETTFRAFACACVQIGLFFTHSHSTWFYPVAT